MSAPCATVVLISGSGSNLQTLIDAQQSGTLNIAIKAVISNKANAYGLQRAREVGVPTQVIEHTEYADRSQFERELRKHIDLFQPNLVLLAGFMRILTPAFVRHYRGRMLNIHPSLLPKYPGLHTHRRALAAGDSVHGATVHFVTEALDGGPPIVQASVPVLPGDTETALAKRVLAQEHVIYPMAANWFAERRLSMAENCALLDGEPLLPFGYRIDSENHRMSGRNVGK
ncbi:MAG: phosphoribosylglycinamide formyltransferase-1 [Cellvibrionaceae bacterium]|jgi:phosphoribosylglycinamide formyltransferase-1